MTMAKALQFDLNDIRPLTDFLRNSKAHVTRLRKTKAPLVLTTNGAASVVVQDALTYQHTMQRLEELEERERFVAAVNEGIAEMKAGRMISLDEARARMEKKFGVRR